ADLAGLPPSWLPWRRPSVLEGFWPANHPPQPSVPWARPPKVSHGGQTIPCGTAAMAMPAAAGSGYLTALAVAGAVRGARAGAGCRFVAHPGSRTILAAAPGMAARLTMETCKVAGSTYVGWH